MRGRCCWGSDGLWLWLDAGRSQVNVSDPGMLHQVNDGRSGRWSWLKHSLDQRLAILAEMGWVGAVRLHQLVEHDLALWVDEWQASSEHGI